MEFDVLDRSAGAFLDTARRAELLAPLGLWQANVLFAGVLRDEGQLRDLLGPSHFKTSGCRDALRRAAGRHGLDPSQIDEETDPSPLMEGLYIKVEEGGVVTDRLKFVRPDFLTRITDAGRHWLERPIVPNGLREGAALFSR